MRPVLSTALEILASGKRGAMATVVRTRGSTPQTAGARLVMAGDGVLTGTVGGGAIEQQVVAALEQCIKDGRARTLGWELGRDLGMCCGGRMEVFVEPIEAIPRLVIFGAGHVAQPTADLARRVGFDVSIVDDREEMNSAERFPQCDRLLAEPAEALARLSPRPEDWFLIVTHDHQLDERALGLVAVQPHRYIGLIGSRRKIVRILERLRHRGPLPNLERVYAPVGVALGAVSPDEIAVSIVAELIALRHGHAAPHMRCIDDVQIARVLAGQVAADSLED